MKEYVMPIWGWIIQVLSMIIVVLFSLSYLLIYQAIILHEYTLYVISAIFIFIGVSFLIFLWSSWPMKIVIYDDDTVAFHMKSKVTTMSVADLYSVRSGRGTWLYHAKGRYAFVASFVNAPLRDFIYEVSRRNPNFVVQ